MCRENIYDLNNSFFFTILYYTTLVHLYTHIIACFICSIAKIPNTIFTIKHPGMLAKTLCGL